LITQLIVWLVDSFINLAVASSPPRGQASIQI